VLAVRVAIALVLAGLCVSGASASGGRTSLHVTVRADAMSAWRSATLRCDPPGGSVAQPGRACSRLRASGRAIFAPTPPGTACTQIYGGPQEALVTGTLDGVNVWARFRRRDGCEIARWNRVAFLLGRLPS